MPSKGRRKPSREEGFLGLGGFLGGLGTLLEKLGELAETGGDIHKSGELHDERGKVRGVYGFTIRTGLGSEGVKVEPFGNVHRDAETGQAVVEEVREPAVDLFEEKDHVLVVAEMPGVAEEDVHLELKDDILVLVAVKGEKKYRKEVLLPASFSVEKMSFVCRNGVLEVRLAR
jgi:HSP20 family protein